MAKKVKIGVGKSLPKYKCFIVDARDTLFFEDRLVVPKGEIKKVIMDEAHNSLLSIHPRSTKHYRNHLLCRLPSQTAKTISLTAKTIPQTAKILTAEYDVSLRVTHIH